MASSAENARRHVDIDAELYRHGQAALALAQTSQPANTTKNYDPKQREWRVRSRSISVFPLVRSQSLI